MGAGVSGDKLHMMDWRGFVRAAPIILFAMLAGTAVIVANPGLYWDDWVWIHQEPAENIRIGKELGIWWAGYLSNAIYANKDPVLLLRVVSLVAWAIGSAAMAYTMWRRRFIGPVEAVLLVTLLCSAHVGIVRFVTSVAMYNVYIASFWVGCAILATAPKNQITRLLSLPFFFFSFHLNSMLLTYLLVPCAFFAGVLVQTVEKFTTAAQPGSADAQLCADLELGFLSLRGLSAHKSLMARVFPSALATHLRRDWIFIALPIVFYIIIKLASLALSTVLASQQRIYSDYNSIRPERIVREVLAIPRVFVGNFLRYFILAIGAVPAQILVAFMAAGAFLACLLPWREELPTFRKSIVQIVVGFVIFAFGVYPYLVVAKPPVVFDFYEGRHILPGLAGLLLTMIGGVNLLAAAASRLAFPLIIVARNAAIGSIVGIGIAGQFILGTDLGKDWLRQEAISSYIGERKAPFSKYGTFLFQDLSSGFRINRRMILNYEYTGNLIKVFDHKEKLGISVQEYESWPKSVPLLTDPVYRRRYNLTDHDPKLPQVVIEINNSQQYPFIKDVLSALRQHWRGRRVDEFASRFFVFTASEQLIEADKNVERMRGLVANIEAFKAENGVYPYSTVLPPRLLQSERIAMRLPGQGSIPAYLNEIPRASGRYGFPCLDTPSIIAPDLNLPQLDLTGPNVPLCKLQVSCFRASCGFLYFSDGIDYKLVYVRPVDIHYVRQAFGELFDPVREGYGFWTKGAARW
jgi:hypothetical protein